MKKTFIYTMILLQAGLFLSSCSEHGVFFPSDDIETTTFDITNFDELEIEDNFKVFVSFGPVEQVEIRCNSNIVRHLGVRRDGRELELKLKPGVAVWGRDILEAHITMKSLRAADLSGNSLLELNDALEIDKLELDVSGNSRLLGEVALDVLKLDASGNSKIEINGVAREIDVDLSGNSKMEDFQLEIEIFHGEFSGNSKCDITITGEIYIEASGNSRLNYKGDAIIKYQELSGLSKVVRH